VKFLEINYLLETFLIESWRKHIFSFSSKIVSPFSLVSRSSDEKYKGKCSMLKGDNYENDEIEWFE
jgi:hypothetical protein